MDIVLQICLKVVKKMRRNLAILGASGHGKVVADTALCSGWQKIIFYDDAYNKKNTKNGPWDIMGNTELLIKNKKNIDGVTVAIGDNIQRMKKLDILKNYGIPIVTIIHPSTVISQYSIISEGCVIFAGSIINSFSEIGKGCIINTASTIDHDCILSEGVHISPGVHLGGDVFIGEMTWIGIGATIKNGIKIGSNTIVGAGAAVINNIENNTIVVGVPAKKIIK
jgi:sugar O-acyltransferase (sialic acid O-acetyltransferase NeuD family)